MKVVSLASGSKGNSYLISTDKTLILIDNGLTDRELLDKLKVLKVNPINIDAIFITHEHGDHIKGLSTFLKKYNPKVYIHNDSVSLVNKKLNNKLKNEIIFYDEDIITFKDILVSNFSQSHDSKHCCGFSVNNNTAKVSFSTDLGYMQPHIIKNLKDSNLIYLEANHDEKILLNNPNYPAYLKQRILSNKGHLSNKSSAEAICSLCYNNARQIVLSHLSEENNSPSLAYNSIKNFLKENGITEGEDIFIDVARQDKIGTVFNITK